MLDLRKRSLDILYSTSREGVTSFGWGLRGYFRSCGVHVQTRSRYPCSRRPFHLQVASPSLRPMGE